MFSVLSIGNVYLRDGSACTCCHSQTQAEDQTCYLTQSASPSTTPYKAKHVAGSHWSAVFQVNGMTRAGIAGIPSSRCQGGSITTGPARCSLLHGKHSNTSTVNKYIHEKLSNQPIVKLNKVICGQLWLTVIFPKNDSDEGIKRDDAITRQGGTCTMAHLNRIQQEGQHSLSQKVS